MFYTQARYKNDGFRIIYLFINEISVYLVTIHGITRFPNLILFILSLRIKATCSDDICNKHTNIQNYYKTY